MTNNTKIVTHLTYTELFDSFERNGAILPIDTLKTDKDIKMQIEYLLSNMNPVEMIQFSSFLNMICQTRDTDKTMIRGISLLEEVGFIEKGKGFSNKIVFHRENLLNLIGQILSKKLSGTDQLTGSGHIESQKKYTDAILLNNDLATLEAETSGHQRGIFIRDYFIREWPHYYLPDITRLFYSHRIVRYRYCFETLLPTLEKTDKDEIEKGIVTLEQNSGVTLSAYIKVLNSLYAWFFEIPFQNEKTPPVLGAQKFGFDFQNISSFYIQTSLFKEDPSFIKTIDHLSKNIDALRFALEQEKQRSRDPITGYNKYVRVFFDNPVFKISEGFYCIIDLKFIIENVCGGLLWRIHGEGNLQNFKSAYGRLLEKYFQFVVKNIFRDAKVSFGETSGADTIIETDDYVFVMEFTTEYYRLSSLYNPTTDSFLDDAYRILFNTGKKDPRSRNKNDKGKLIKLNQYIEDNKGKGKIIIPVIVTENFLGNHDLFNEFDNFYSKEVKDKKLINLEETTPLFLCLDDLETFWGLFDPKDAVKGFAGFNDYWVSKEKGHLFHNPSSGMCKFIEEINNKEPRINNHEFADFFSPKQTFKE